MKLNKAQIAAMNAGATPEAIAALASAPDPVEATSGDAAGAEAAAAAAAAATSAAAAAGAAAPDAAAAEAAPAVAASLPADTAMIASLNGQLTTVNASLVTAQAEITSLKAQVATIEPLAEGLRAALSEKMVALGASAETVAAISADKLGAEYVRISAVHQKQFRPGGVAAVGKPEEKSNTEASSVSAMERAMMAQNVNAF